MSDGQALAAELNSLAVVTSGHDSQAVYFLLHPSREVNLGDEIQKPRKLHTPLFRDSEPEASVDGSSASAAPYATI